MSILIDIADEIVSSINASVFSPAIVATRAHAPVFDLSKVDQNIVINVIPREMAVDPESRTTSQFKVTTEIGVQRRIDPNTTASTDAMHSLVEQIIDHLRFKTLNTNPAAQWSTVEVDPVLFLDHLERFNVFTSVIAVTHFVTR